MISKPIKEKKLFQAVRSFRWKQTNGDKMRLKKAANGYAEKGDEAYFEDLATLAAKRTKMFLLSLPLKKIFREMT